MHKAFTSIISFHTLNFGHFTACEKTARKKVEVRTFFHVYKISDQGWDLNLVF